MIYNKALREVLRGWTFLGISAAVLAFLVIQFELREDDLRLAILEGSFPEAIEQPTEAPTVIEDSVSAAESADGLKVETDSGPPSTDEEPSDASALVPPPTPDAPCRVLDDLSAIVAQRLNTHGQRELDLRQEASVFAPIAGKVAKIFNNPTMGLTIYLVNESGTECLGLGGFDGLTPTVAKGRSISCGTLLGTVKGRLYLERYQIAAGKEWWQGQRIDPTEL